MRKKIYVTLKRVNLLVKYIECNHFEGIGKPDALKDYENIKKNPSPVGLGFFANSREN
ncbi:MAG: type II toxin-antitoxin system YoeB family toxin [Fibrobacter sp.]|nr:type II toxin-antitoxin system YoeB family toxin [Fibrobacter sp.]MBR3073457.1 type II toxin-antitoxin system YoeB family toxin [Fibrobacter sp.]